MIDKNDLYDIAFSLVTIRNNIYEKSNMQVLHEIINALQTEDNVEDNQIRKIISSIEGLDCDRWFFVYHNNIYVNHQVLKNTNIYGLLVKLLQTLYCLINQEKFDEAYDLVDSFHNLPEIIADNHLTIPKSVWKTFLKCYRNKWDDNFLLLEQKHYKKYL